MQRVALADVRAALIRFLGFLERSIPPRLVILLIALALTTVISTVVMRLALKRRAAGQAQTAGPLPSAGSKPPPKSPAPPTWEPSGSVLDERYAIPRIRATRPFVPWTTRQVLLSVAAVAATFVVVLASIYGLAQVLDFSGWGEHVILLGATIILQGVMLLCVWLFAVRPAGGRWDVLGFRRVKPISTTLIAIGGITTCQAVVVAYVLLIEALGIDFLVPGDPFESWDIDPVSFAIIAFSAIIIAPLFEEMFFRGFMYQAFRRSMAIWPAAILSSLIFGIAHIDVAIIIPIALVGMILLGIYRWTGNLWSSIITHTGYNAIAIAALAVQTWGA